MGMPNKLKHFNVFQDGVSFIGQTAELTLPKLARKMEEWRGGGMIGPVEVDYGMEKMELEWSLGGIAKEVLDQFGRQSADAVLLRFAGSYQNDDNGRWMAVEVVARGRFKEIDFDKAKAGDDTSLKVTMPLTYYKLSINGVVSIEIDVMNMIQNIGGKDTLTEVRKILGV